MNVDRKVKLVTRPPSERLLGWKVPFREVYCETFATWVRETIWCHFVIKVFPHAVDLGSARVESYLDAPSLFYLDHERVLYEVAAERELARLKQGS